MTLDVEAVRTRFPGLEHEQDGRPIVFADAPGGSQVPATVIEAMADYLRRLAPDLLYPRRRYNLAGTWSRSSPRRTPTGWGVVLSSHSLARDQTADGAGHTDGTES